MSYPLCLNTRSRIYLLADIAYSVKRRWFWISVRLRNLLLH